MKKKYTQGIVSIKPNGEMAGYYAELDDVRKVLDEAILTEVEKAIESGDVYLGLKWMRSEDHRDAWFAKVDLSFPVPEDYHIYLKNPVRMTAERKKKERQKEAMDKRMARVKEISNLVKSKCRENVVEEEVKVSTRGMRVYCPETGDVYENVHEASRQIGISEKAIYSHLSDRTAIKRLNIHVKRII
ncbi:MAG: hypothetical protein ACI36Z_10070 [Alloprevotella sp.]